jgi:RNA binding exosome subunit
MTEYNDKLRVPYGMAVHDTEEENAVLEIIKNKKTIMGDKVK